MIEAALLLLGILFFGVTVFASYWFSRICKELLGIRKELEKDNE